jgi:protein-disulfide isomerase
MSSKESRRSARDKLAEERRKQAEADKRRSRLINIGIAVVVILAVTAIFVLVQKQRNSGPPTAALPATVTTQGGGVNVGKSTAPVKLDLWEDFQCPICKQFEKINATQIAAMTDAGEIRVVYHPVSFLDQNNNNTASALAANAFGCSAASGLQQKFHNMIFMNQPPEGTGYTTDELIQWGKDVGITASDWPSCVQKQPYADWVSQVESSMTAAGITGTPTVFIDGKLQTPAQMRNYYTDPKALADAIAAAKSGG